MNIIQRLDNWWSEHSANRRLDRGPVYVAVLVGLTGPALSIVLFGPVPNSAIAEMGDNLQVSMCSLILLHTVIGLYATLSGSRWFVPNMSRKRSYRYGYSAMPAGVAALFVYGYFLLANAVQQIETKIVVLSALSGILTPALGVGILIQGCLFWLESRRIERNERILLQEKRIELEDERERNGDS